MAIVRDWPKTHYVLLSTNLQHIATEIVYCSHFVLPDELIKLLVISTLFQQIKYLKLNIKMN